MSEGWKVRSQVHIEHPDGSRTTKLLQDLTDRELREMQNRWASNLKLAGYEVKTA